jgi:hypothetical protein
VKARNWCHLDCKSLRLRGGDTAIPRHTDAQTAGRLSTWRCRDWLPGCQKCGRQADHKTCTPGDKMAVPAMPGWKCPRTFRVSGRGSNSLILGLESFDLHPPWPTYPCLMEGRRLRFLLKSHGAIFWASPSKHWGRCNPTLPKWYANHGRQTNSPCSVS